MGLLQKAVETYDSHLSLVDNDTDGKAVLAPVAHTVRKVDLELVLTAEGMFDDANASCQGESIIIPASMESAGRSGTAIAPHPLSDQLCYIAPFEKEKYEAYIKQLSAWAQSQYAHPKLQPILNYVTGGTILQDLERVGLIRLNANGRPDKKAEKLMVRWRVVGLDDGANENCWKDETLFTSYCQYYLSCLSETSFCMISGVTALTAKQHAKGIVPLWPSAKLVSSNDITGFTYRGRFAEGNQALTIGYEASQKAHNALRWLVDSQGVRANYGKRTFLCWMPNGKTMIPPHRPFMAPPKPITQPSDYRDDLQKALWGRKADLDIQDDVVLAAFDAATTGRLALTYYNELQAHDFLERLYDWDVICCWPHKYKGIVSPNLSQIVNCAFGTQRTVNGVTKMITDDRILREQMQQLIACRVDRAFIGAHVINSLVNHASNLAIYKEFDSSIGQRDIREDLLSTACAVIRKYRKDRFKEEWNMALEPERKDRSYQYGRLLAVMEKVERDTYGSGESREPNAIRQQSVFCQRPMQTAANLEKQLERAYFPRLKPGSRIRYKNLIGQIMEVISQFSDELDKPLDGTYLLGYYLQRAALYTKNTDEEMEENENG